MIYSKLLVPLAFVYKDAAKAAIKQQIALPLAGGAIAFSMVKIIYRDTSKSDYMTVSELKLSTDIELRAQLELIMKARFDICGLNMSKPHVMGILNITPDSFSDGGVHDSLPIMENKIDHYIEKGLSIIDIGGESTRPGADYVTCAEEIVRIKPILSMLKTKNICVSIDTRKARVMAYALEHGADMINDVSALEFRANIETHAEDSGDSEQVVVSVKCPVVLMHSQGTPDVMQNNPTYDNILFDIYDYLQNRIVTLTPNNYDLKNIIIDPGIGFGKTFEHNLMIIKNISVFHSLGVVIMVGASRKGFIGKVVSEIGVLNRLGGSLAISNLCHNYGIQISRMHDIEDAIQQNLMNHKIH